MYSVYILYSVSADAWYVGQSVDAIARTNQHNQHFYPKASTAKASDWQLKLEIKVQDRMEALKVESYIKSMKSKAYLKNGF